MKLFLRPADPEDLPTILQVQNLSLRMSSPPLADATREALIAHQATLRQTLEELILVVTCNEQIVGFIALMLKPARISGLFVHPDFVRQGIGSELLAAAEELVQTNKYRRSLFVLASESAKDFYRKRGFRVLWRQALWLNRHDHVRTFWMRKYLRDLTPAEKQQRLVFWSVTVLVVAVSLWVAIAKP